MVHIPFSFVPVSYLQFPHRSNVQAGMRYTIEKGGLVITIRELLNRIRWNPEFSRGDYAIGYFDRFERRIIVIPLGIVWFQPDDHFSLVLNDAAGEALSIPLHRVYEVYRNGELIWHREVREGRGGSGG